MKDISITSSGSTLYIADASYVLKSTNSGSGWAVTSQPYSSPLLVLVKPDDDNIVHAAINGNLSRSTNGGSSWTTVPNLTDLTPLRLVAAVNDNNIMLLGRTFVSGNNAIWRSSNGGADWSKVTTFGAVTNVYDFAAYPTTGQGRNGVILAGGINPNGPPEGSSHSSPATTSGLWKSSDYGLNWDENGLGDCNVRSVAIVPKPSGTDYIRLTADNVASGTDGLWRNISLTDAGQWTQITLSPAPADIYLIRRKASNGYIFLAASNGVWKSTNDGASFTQVGLTGTDVISITVSSTGNNVFAGTATTLYKSTDNGSNWTNVGDINVSSVEAAQITVGETSTQYSWAVTKDNNIAARYNGTSWERKTIGNEGVQFSTENIYRNPSTGKLFAAGALGSTGALYSSTNDGTSYTQISITNYTLQTGSQYFGTVRDASGVMYAFGGGTLASGGSGWRNVFNSTDEGTTWNAIADVGGNSLWVHDLVGATGSTLYAAASDGNVYRSTNGGTNWTSTVDVGAVARSIAVNPAYPTDCLCGW